MNWLSDRASDIGAAVIGGAESAWDNSGGRAVSAVSDRLPNCFTWQEACQSLVTKMTSGRHCSRLFEAGCTEPIGEVKATLCPAYGCVAVTYDGTFHHHEALGMAFNIGIGFSPTVSSCEAHDEAFVNAGPFGVSGARFDPEGGWQPSFSFGANPPSPFNWGFGLVHWFN